MDFISPTLTHMEVRAEGNLGVLSEEDFVSAHAANGGSFCNLQRIGPALGSQTVGWSVSERWSRQWSFAVIQSQADGHLQRALNQQIPQVPSKSLEKWWCSCSFHAFFSLFHHCFITFPTCFGQFFWPFGLGFLAFLGLLKSREAEPKRTTALRLTWSSGARLHRKRLRCKGWPAPSSSRCLDEDMPSRHPFKMNHCIMYIR